MYKAAAVLCLLLAIAAVAAALLASQRRVAIQGPSAIAPLPDGSTWLAVEEALWRLDAEGRRVAVVAPSVHGLPRAIAALVRHPDGRLVAWVRGDARLHFLDPQTGAPRGQLLPQWPADLREHGDRAIHYAFHPDGRVAIATGGGHTVAVFDGAGRYLGRSPPGAYEFTNGLWWRGDRLWTTDTNRFTLVELDAASFAVISRVPLAGPFSRHRFLGMAAEREDAAAGRGDASVNLVRFANGMLEGEVVQVQPDGRTRVWRTETRLEPRDLKWRAGELMLVDGAGYSVKRFSAQGDALGDLGDATVQGALAQRLREREALGGWYRTGLAAAVVLFLIGLGLAWRTSVLDKGQRLHRLDVDLSQLGTPLLDVRARLWFAARLLWPLAGAGLGLFAFRFVAGRLAVPGLTLRESTLLGMLVVLVAGLAAGVWVFRRLRRSDPALDTFLNQMAVTALATRPLFWELREPGEVPRETLLLTQGLGERRWLVLTQRRLLVFAFNLADASLHAEHARRDIARARVLPPAELPWTRRLIAGLSGACWLRLEMRDGSVLEGMTLTHDTAHRLVQLLHTVAPPASPSSRPRAPALAPGQVPDESRAVRQVFASLLVPGLGQWMQGRSGTALWMFLAWAVVLIGVALPVAWTLWAPRAAVSSRTVLLTLTAYAMVCASAGIDAWRMRHRAGA